MAGAPLIGTALTGIGMVSQAASQRQAQMQGAQQARNSIEAAEAKYRIDSRRFDYAQNAAQQQFFKEQTVMAEQTRMAREQLVQAKLQEDLRIQQAEAQRSQATSQVQQQVGQLLTAASNAETQLNVDSASQLFQLVSALGQTDQGRQRLATRLNEAANSPIQDNALDLADIAAYQNTLNQVATNQRAADAVSQAASNEAGIMSEYAQLLDEYLGTTEEINQQMNRYMLEIQPSLLSLQDQRNQAALEAARDTQAAEMALGRTSSLFQLQNNISTAANSVPRTSGSAASVFNTLAQVVPQAVVSFDSLFGVSPASPPPAATRYSPTNELPKGVMPRQAAPYNAPKPSPFNYFGL